MTSFRTMQTKDLHYLRAAFFIILFWYGVWNLADYAIERLHQKTGVKKELLFAILSLMMISIILVDPYVFEKI